MTTARTRKRRLIHITISHDPVSVSITFCWYILCLLTTAVSQPGKSDTFVMLYVVYCDM